MDEHRRSPFGNALRHLREAAALSQEELAERAGLSVRGVSDLERGARTTPRLETVRMLADGLGLDEAERHQLLAARNHASDAPTMHALQTVPTLPIPVTSFIGRDAEISTIGHMVQVDHHRLITLLGPGGVGKTRIAIEVAHRLAAGFKSGAIFVDLSPIRDPDLVLPAIASRLGVTERADRSLKEGLSVALHGRQLLLVLDNLEQVIDAATDIAWLHASLPELSIIVTSRVRTRVAAEHVLPIETMPLPTGADATALRHVDAVELFLHRAQAVDPGFSLSSGNADAVAAIVTRLQGMPLAIELAAARIRLWSIADLLSRLETQLSMLTGGARDAPHRHSTMRETIAWSYDLLSPTEQAVFRTLAIFPDGCTLETAVAVCGVEGRFSDSETLDAVEMLVDSSLLRRRDGADGQVRFRMLQTLKEFGLEKLASAGEEGMVREAAHAAWAIPLARKCEFVQARPDSVFWLNRIGAEIQNLRQHQAWLISNDYMEDALDLSGSLASYRALRTQFSESREELETLLHHPRNQHPTRERIRGVNMLAMTCMNQTDTEHALAAAEQGIALARQLDERWYLAQALIISGVTMWITGDLDDAEARTREGVDIARDLDSKFLTALGTGSLALVISQRGDWKRAFGLWEEAHAISESIGDRWGMAICKVNLGYSYIRAGDLNTAEALLLDAQELLIELGDVRDIPGVDLNLADIARIRGDLPEAEMILQDSLARAQTTGNMGDIAFSNQGLAQVARLRGDLQAAQSFGYEALCWFERCGNMIGALLNLADEAEMFIAAGESTRAAWCIGAMDGALAHRRISQDDAEIAERHARIDAVMPVLGEAEWQVQYDRGFAASDDEILATVKSWLSSQETGVESARSTGPAR